MPIISTSFNDIGNAGQVPSIVRIETDDSLSTVLTAGYLNVLTHQNLPLSENSLALVSTGTGVNKAVTVMSMTYSSGNWSLVVMEGYQASGGGGGVTSVTGTSNRITSTGGTTPVIDIAATYVGQASITTVGAIGSGTWASTAIPVTNGGTGLTTMTTAYAPVISGTTATGALQVASTGQSNSGYVLTSTGSSSLPTWQAAAGGGGMTWASIAGTTQAAAVNTGYVVSNAGQTTITLPVTAPLGSVVAIQGSGAAGWILAPGAGQTIKVGQSSASTSVTSAANYDAIQVVCIVANTTWATSYVLSSGVTTA